MIDESYFMIKCIAKDSPNIVEKLSCCLTSQIHKQWPHFLTTIESVQDYWKEDGYKQIIFRVTFSKNSITIKNFMKIFNIIWQYSMHTNEEEAVWSKLENPTETFLIEDIEWVHIYSW